MNTLFRLFLLIGICFLLPSVSPSVQAQTRLDSLLLEQINMHRQKLKKGELKSHPALWKAAQHHSIYLMNTGECDHLERRGKGRGLILPTPLDRIKKYYREPYLYVNENVACREDDVEDSEDEKVARELFLQWKNSSGHLKNMNYPSINQAGVSVQKSEMRDWNGSLEGYRFTAVFMGLRSGSSKK